MDPDLVNKVAEALIVAGLPVNTGATLTVSTASGTAATALERAARISGATAEGMEGYGVAIAAADLNLPVIEIRAISNVVGPRDREAWRIVEALAQLEAASSVLREVWK